MVDRWLPNRGRFAETRPEGTRAADARPGARGRDLARLRHARREHRAGRRPPLPGTARPPPLPGRSLLIPRPPPRLCPAAGPRGHSLRARGGHRGTPGGAPGGWGPGRGLREGDLGPNPGAGGSAPHPPWAPPVTSSVLPGASLGAGRPAPGLAGSRRNVGEGVLPGAILWGSRSPLIVWFLGGFWQRWKDWRRGPPTLGVGPAF